MGQACCAARQVIIQHQPGFLTIVPSRFRGCVECLVNQGSEFRGEFQDLFDHALIDHRWTSRDHPQADGLVKRMVQTCKKGLQKIYLTKNKEDWNLALPYIAMGYRMSKHTSLFHFSPYFLLFRKHPIPYSNGPSCGLGLPSHLG